MTQSIGLSRPPPQRKPQPQPIQHLPPLPSGASLIHTSGPPTPQPQASRARSPSSTSSYSGDASEDPKKHTPPSILARIQYAATISALSSATATTDFIRSWREYLYPPPYRPDIIKAYECRAYLPIRIFFPASYDQTSPQPLPTLFTIHAGLFTHGISSADDLWNRTFADAHNTLVISLDYRKAPWSPFPTPLHDVEALYLATVTDASLPIDAERIAVSGFGAGGNLATGLCQLDSLQMSTTIPKPKALISLYAPLDLFSPLAPKLKKRPYKSALGRLRGDASDMLAPFAPAFEWSYVPYNHSLTDPRLSPVLAQRENLPDNVFIIAAELDYLAHESWNFACRLAGRREPRLGGMVGRLEPAKQKGSLELEDDRFAWEDSKVGVRWLMVPDVVHGFDMHEPARSMMDQEGVTDADVKTVACMAEVAQWLERTAWKQ